MVRAKSKYYPKNSEKEHKKLFWIYNYNSYNKEYTSIGGVYWHIKRKEDKYILIQCEEEREFNSLNEAKEYAQKDFEQMIKNEQ